MSSNLSAIVAVARNGVIGMGNDLPWRLSADLKHFKEITLGHHIIMGRRNYESIGRPLPGRTNLVISRQIDLVIPGCQVVRDLSEALEITEAAGDKEPFLIGGAQIYALGLSQCRRLYWTRVQAEPEGDVMFPTMDWSQWRLLSSEHHPADEKNQYALEFQQWERVD